VLHALKRDVCASRSLLISPYRRVQKYHLEIKTFSEEISQNFSTVPTHKIIRIIGLVNVTDPTKRKNCPNIYSMATGARISPLTTTGGGGREGVRGKRGGKKKKIIGVSLTG
jgi:hypothetical protein